MIEQKRRIAALTKRKFDSNKDDSLCSICYDLKTDDIAVVRCSHSFHITCLETWLEKRNSCPLCKTEVAQENLLEPSLG